MTNTMTGGVEVSFDETIPSSFVLDKQMRADLREPFPPEQIGQVNKGFGIVDFIGHAAITDRLNRAAPGWTYRVEPVVITGKDGLPHVMAVFGTMTVGGVTRQEVGDVEHMTRYGDELKKAISDFICRGAMRFGVGLDLWSKEQLESPSRETPASPSRESSPASTEAGDSSALVRGTGSGAEGAGREPSRSSTGPIKSSSGRQGARRVESPGAAATSERERPLEESSEGTTAARDAGTRGTTADPSDSSAPAAGPPTEAARQGDGVATKGSGSVGSVGSASPEPAGAKRKKKYPLDPKQCLHTVGVDLDLRCVDCGTKMAEASA